MGYPLYGHEINEDIFPLDAGLNRFIDWEKDFIGKTALLQYKESGAKRKLVCFAADSRRSPRAEQKIFSADNKEIGIVTSGTFSPTLSQGVGLAFVPVDLTVGQEIFFGAEKNLVPARIVSRPIYKEGSLRQ
jgi:aminomethyltransferase